MKITNFLVNLSLISLFSLVSQDYLNNTAVIYQKVNDTQVLLVFEKDITYLQVDAIVNAANAQLLGGSGVCGIIFNQAGATQLQAACNKYKENKNGERCPTGSAVITPAFNLEKRGIKNIIHAVGPIYNKHDNLQKQNELLSSVYYTSLILAEKNGLISIAFPFISSGIYGYPKDEAAQAAIIGIKKYLDSTPATDIKLIVISVFGHDGVEAFKKAFEIFRDKNSTC